VHDCCIEDQSVSRSASCSEITSIVCLVFKHGALRSYCNNRILTKVTAHYDGPSLNLQTTYECLLLLQSALQPLWILACSTIVGYSQQEGFLQSAVASGTSNLQPGGPVIRTFQLPPPGVPHVWNHASEPQQWKMELWARNCREFCRKWQLPRHFWVLLRAVNLQHGTDGFTSPPKEGALRIFRPKNLTALAGFEPMNSGTRGQHAYV